MKSAKNIIEFPTSKSIRMQLAIKAFEKKENMTNLAAELMSLADEGFPEADLLLGNLYEEGTANSSEYLPFVKDYTRALQHYELAAKEGGYTEAYLALGRIFYHGGGGIEKDLPRAKDMYEKVKKTNQHPVACFMLGRMYQYGEGVKKDLNKAEHLYNMAIEKGNLWGMVNLALLYEEKKMYLSSLLLRAKAGIQSIFIYCKNPCDERLRGG